MVTLRFLAVVLCTVATAAGTASPSLSPRVLHERRSAPPHGWAPSRRADPDMVLPLSIALRQSNADKLDHYLLDVADPESPNYGRWWTPARVLDTFAPSKDTREAVRAWLVDYGIDVARIRMSKDRAYMHADVSVQEAERLLAATYYVYQNADGSEDVGCHHGYHLPEHLVHHVDLVTPTVHFEKLKLVTHSNRRKSKRGLFPAYGGNMHRPNGAPMTPMGTIYNDVDHCDQQATLDCFRALYDFYPNLTQTDKNTVGVVELADQSLNGEDLHLFLQQFNPAAANQLPTLVGIDLKDQLVNFTVNDPALTSEPDLDFELMIGLLGAEQNVTLYQVGSGGSLNFLLDGLDGSYCTFDGGDDPNIDGVVYNEDCGTAPPSNVFSISFTGGEDLPAFYMERQCKEFGKLSMMGMTFLVASGDDGVASNGDNLCLAANGTAVPGDGNFLPNFPSTCPYVTAVGATQVAPNGSVHEPEIAPMLFGSGGGFSNVFAQPKFQQKRVARYLRQLGDAVDPGLFNRSGRGIPDVSANGFPTAVVLQQNFTLSGGTSASTPIFGAILTAVNDARLAAHKTPVGWINPAIYSHWFADAFHDVTNGSNPGCGTDGFPALPGWDPVTGLGTPDFPKLVKRFLYLP
ncbi:subtilisin-like protein [Trametes elegans]|nr:subtilisin-like protein [Trametes elegans]